MIASRQSGVTVAGNITGQSYQAGIDDENMGWVISLFTDLYSDPQAAVIREYPTNAHDAQVEVGNTDPIEVTLPSGLSPFYKVADKGVGLSAEDIQRIYSRYGSSTKRGTNDQNGMLGMGCKSALAYCQQFTVESVKDGMRTVCSISREDDGVPVFTVVASVPDDGPNGTEVIVPVQRHHHSDFERKAALFFRHWKPGTVLVNGAEPAKVEGLTIEDGIVLVKNPQHSYNRVPNIIVMGNVAYPVTEDEMDLGLPSSYHAIITVPIGSVDFAPSREALLYNKTTRATLQTLPERVEAATAKAVEKEIQKAQTPRAALRSLFDWRDLMPRGSTTTFKFKGRAIPELIAGHFILVPWSARKMSQHSVCAKGVNVEHMTKALVVVGYDLTSFTATHKRKLEQYVAENSLDQPEYFALTAVKPDMTWLDASQIIQWDDVKAIKLPKSSPVWRNGRPTGSYDATIDAKHQHIQADEIDTNEAIYYCRALNRWEASRYVDIITKHDPSATIVYLPENRHAKFCRNFPDAKSHTVGLQEAYDAWASSLTKGEKLALAIADAGETHTLQALDPSRIEDPAIRKACLIARNVDVDPITRARRAFNGVLYAITDTASGAEWTNPLERYPLMGDISHRRLGGDNDGHVYIYLNAAYAAMEAAAANDAADAA